MESEQNRMAELLPKVAAQMRGALNNLHLAATHLASAEDRARDPELDLRAARLDQSYYQLLRLVNNLSMATHLTNDAPLPLSNQELVKFVGDRCAELGAEAPQLGLDFRFVCTLERHISAVNSEALRKILEHLLSNAYKFTPAGGTITVELRVSHGRVLLTVTDTGCGISEERLETLFDRYLHPQTMDLPVHGLGLGLPLCRRLAEAQGGALLAESRPGQGSRFTLSLPDRQVEGGVSDVPLDYMIGENGFNPTLEALADVLPAKAFLQRYLD